MHVYELVLIFMHKRKHLGHYLNGDLVYDAKASDIFILILYITFGILAYYIMQNLHRIFTFLL